MKARLHEISTATLKRNACNARRNFPIDLQESVGEFVEKAGLIKKAINEILIDKKDEKDVMTSFAAAFEEIPYPSDRQREVHGNDAWRQIKRYTTCERRPLIPAVAQEIEMGEDLTVYVNPDYLVMTRVSVVESINPRTKVKTLKIQEIKTEVEEVESEETETKEAEPKEEEKKEEASEEAAEAAPKKKTTTKKEKEEPKGEEMTKIDVIKLKTSKPNVTQAQAYKDLGLHAMIRYAQTLVAPGEKAFIQASYYFLRKNNDSSSMENPNFDASFFDLKGAGNIVSLSEVYENIPGTSEDLEETRNRLVKEYVTGVAKEECSKEDCEKCKLKNLCRYTNPPKALVKTPVNRSLKDLSLSEAQERIVEYEDGICRVNAGAGAGKTMVIALRTATLLNKGVRPENMLLITFTNAGAEEMRDRIGKLLEDFGIEVDLSEMYIMTFNAFGDLILKAEYARLGFTDEPKIIDDVERSRIIADLLNENRIKDLDYRNFDSNQKTCMGALALAKVVFGIVKAGQYNVSDFEKVAEEMGAKKRFCSRESLEELIALYDKYDEKLRAENLIEFADQEVLVKEILHKDPYYLERFGFEHVIVDEFQDSNEGQIELLKKFRACPKNKSLMVVGDDSQSIYGFRNTTPYFILHFDEVMGEKVDDIMLVENYRSTPEVIYAANKFNEWRADKINKDLIATRPSGKQIVAKGFLTAEEENTFVIEDIKKHLEDGVNPEDIAIIAATKYELMKMADLLGQENIPSVMLNPEPLLENSRVIAGISFCRAMQDNSDTLDSMVYANAKVGGTLMTATKEVLEAALADAQSDLESVHAIPDENGRKARLMELLEALDDEDEVYESFLETLKRKPMAKLFEYVNDFTRFGSAAAVRRTHSYPGVVLTTAHSSKGLEWPVVYNMLSKYETPEMNSRSPIADEIYEERKRLLFVSATRARDELIMTGQYLAYGNAKDGYRINTFLQKSMDIAESTQPDYDPNKSSFTYADVMQMKAERKAEAERLKKKAELAKKLDEAEALESKMETPQAV